MLRLSAPVIGSSQVICDNTAPALLTVTTPAGGGSGVYSYQWQYSADGLTGWGDVGTPGTSYQPAALTSDAYYRTIATDIGTPPCGSITSNTIHITVQDPVTAGEIQEDQTICYNTVPGPMTSLVIGTGSGDITYKWEFDEGQGAGWQNIAGATGPDYTPTLPRIYSTRYHRITVSTTGGVACYSAPTDFITVAVQTEVVAGSIAASQTICYNTAPAELTSTAPGTGSGTTISYIWEYSTNGGGSWTPIAGANGLNYQPGRLTSTTMFHRITRIHIEPGELLFPADSPGDDHGKTCRGKSRGRFRPGHLLQHCTCAAGATAATGGSGSFTYLWQQYNGATWDDLTGEAALTYQPPALTGPATYRISATDVCGTVYSNEVYITIETEKPVITCPQEVRSPVRQIQGMHVHRGWD
ncbi:MAG: hypothetical protein MZV63_56040 [Marinilabiliales bacterium]|nr:hypothetical protein [Marinilabiliales bacterium]